MKRTTNIPDFHPAAVMCALCGGLLAWILPTDCLRSLENRPPFQRAFRQSVGNPEAICRLYEKVRQQQLPSIEHGVDSFEYRLWCPKDADLLNLIRIRNDGGKWVITETSIWSHIPEHRFRRRDTVNYLKQTIVDSFHTHTLEPRIPVQAFIDSLQYFNLQEASTDAAIDSSLVMSTDSWRYIFELADKVHYRIIEYNVGSVLSLQSFHEGVSALLFFLKRQLNVEFRDP